MVKVIQGEDKTFAVTLRKSQGDPYDLTGVTEITFCFPGETAVQTVTLGASEVAIVNAVLGKITVTITDTKTALMKIGEDQTFECMIDVGTTRTKVKFTEQLNVFDSIC